MSPLLQLQQKFTRLLPRLYDYIHTNGWECTQAEGTNLEHVGHMAHSLHYLALAQDLNLFVGGVWQTKDCPEWQSIGAYWLTLDPDCRWGGKFTSVDLDHFSLTFGGLQ